MDIQFSLMRLAIIFEEWTAVKDCIKKVRGSLVCASSARKALVLSA